MNAWEIAGGVGSILATMAIFALAIIAFARLGLGVEAWWSARCARLEASGPETAVAQEQRAADALEYSMQQFRHRLTEDSR